MKHKHLWTVWELTKVLLVLGFGAVVLQLLLGCAAIPAEQHDAFVLECDGDETCLLAKEDAYLEQQQYERDHRYALHLEKYDATVKWCRTQPNMAMDHDYSCSYLKRSCPPRNTTDLFTCRPLPRRRPR